MDAPILIEGKGAGGAFDAGVRVLAHLWQSGKDALGVHAHRIQSSERATSLRPVACDSAVEWIAVIE